jgi:hypothetical protein
MASDRCFLISKYSLTFQGLKPDIKKIVGENAKLFCQSYLQREWGRETFTILHQSKACLEFTIRMSIYYNI